MSASVDRILSLISAPAAQSAVEAVNLAATPAAARTFSALARAERLSKSVEKAVDSRKEAQAPRILPVEGRKNTSGSEAEDAFVDWERRGGSIHGEEIDPAGRLHQTSDDVMPVGGRRGDVAADTLPGKSEWTVAEAEKLAGMMSNALFRAGLGGTAAGLARNVYNKETGGPNQMSGVASAAMLGALGGVAAKPIYRTLTAPRRLMNYLGKPGSM